MHNAAFNALGIDALYTARDVAPEDLTQVIKALRAPDVWGANVTVPHKRAVLAFMDDLSDAAKRIGAVNTIVNKNGYLYGDNTDAPGYLRALADANITLKDADAVLLGAGGAARAIVYALLTAGVKRLSIHNRTPEKAQALATEFSTLGNVQALPDEELTPRVHGADLLINSTSLGMSGLHEHLSPLPAGLLPYNGFVSDIVYVPARTKLLKDATLQGLATQNGLPMLIYQGAESFTRWTGQNAPIPIMFSAARTALESR